MYIGGRLGQRDFFAVELFDALPYLVVDFGDGVHRFRLSRHATRVNNGSAHHVKVERSSKTLTLYLDDEVQAVNISSSFTSLDLGNSPLHHCACLSSCCSYRDCMRELEQ